MALNDYVHHERNCVILPASGVDAVEDADLADGPDALAAISQLNAPLSLTARPTQSQGRTHPITFRCTRVPRLHLPGL